MEDDRLVVFESPRYIFEGNGMIPRIPHYTSVKTIIRIYDVSDKENPLMVGVISVNGSYFSSRMIGDYVYVIVNQPAIILKGEVPLPAIALGDKVHKVRATDIKYSNTTDYSYTFTIILSFNIKNYKEATYKVFLLGATRCIYVSQRNIYITIPRFVGKEATEIHRIHIEDGSVIHVADGIVPGYILNQFSMDEYKGYFRIATTTGRSQRNSEVMKNNIYVLSLDLEVVGRLEGLAPNERIYSARFVGDRCYLVTFMWVDPFFVIDLSDPENPRELGRLKIPGFSRYLHPYDENYIIGIGMEESSVKISLFNVSDLSNPEEVDKYVVPWRSSTPALWDHKSILFSKSRDLLVIPITIMEKHLSWRGAYVFNITVDGIRLRGTISHMNSISNIPKKGYVEPLSEYPVKRALYIGDILYTLSDLKIKMNSLEDLSLIGEVKLPLVGE